jgi:hypothetical protein
MPTAFYFSFVKNFELITRRLQLRSLSKNIAIMASSSYNVYLPNDTIPTAATKITLADRILVSPLSK